MTKKASNPDAPAGCKPPAPPSPPMANHEKPCPRMDENGECDQYHGPCDFDAVNKCDCQHYQRAAMTQGERDAIYHPSVIGEHKPPTDEELAEWEELGDCVTFGMLREENALRLIAEVRLLRKERSGFVVASAVDTAILGKRMSELDASDRTLELPNGVVPDLPPIDDEIVTTEKKRSHPSRAQRASGCGGTLKNTTTPMRQSITHSPPSPAATAPCLGVEAEVGRCIIKIKDRYFVWSTIVDAPVTYGMTDDELHEYIKEELGREGQRELPERLKRVDEKGASWQSGDDLESTLMHNRAGADEECLTEEEIYERYVDDDRPVPGGK